MAPKTIFEYQKMHVFPLIDSLQIPMPCQVERNLNSDAFRHSEDKIGMAENEWPWLRTMARSHFFQSSKHLAPIKIKEKQPHLKEVRLKEIKPVENDWQDPSILPRL
jgi:hypothetical protein